MVPGAVALLPPWLDPLGLVGVIVALATLVAVRRLLGRPLTAGLRDRFVLGLPWGTLLTVVGVLVVYAVVQGGWEYPGSPLVLPFRSWGYDYLTGTLFSAFAHNGWGHLTGNVTATVAFAGVAEYAWGHYPRRRGAATFSSLGTNPYARILAVPAVAVVVGIFTSLTGLGPLVGFSGVVFAFAGFGIVQLPIVTTLALAGVRILRLLLSTITTPTNEVGIYPATITPWWADVAIQTHGVGMLVGLLAGLALARHRGEWANPLHVWFAALVYAIAQGMWAVFLPITGSSWLLLRFVGTILVFLLATLAAVGAYRRDRPLWSRAGLGRRKLAVGLLVVGLAAMSIAAVPFHVAPVGEEPAPNSVVEVRDYSVGYGENVPQGYVGAVDVVGYDLPSIPTSGVIVTNADRNLWRLVIPKERLSSRGGSSVLIGGVGWRERVYADWRGWRVAGNRSVYKVFLAPAEGEWRQAYASGPSRSDVVVAGYNLTLAPADEGFTVSATGANRTFGPVRIPESGSNVTLGPVTFERNGQRLIAVHDGTRVPLATRTEKAG